MDGVAAAAAAAATVFLDGDPLPNGILASAAAAVTGAITLEFFFECEVCKEGLNGGAINLYIFCERRAIINWLILLSYLFIGLRRIVNISRTLFM